MLAFGIKIQTFEIADDAVTNPKLADMAQALLKGRAAGAGTGDPQDLTATQVRAIINVEDGATADQSAAEVPYSNTTSGLTATDVQAAIDEIDGTLDGLANGMVFKGDHDVGGGGGPVNFPGGGTAEIGDFYVIVNAAPGGTTLGTSNPVVVHTGDNVVASSNNASETDGADWVKLDNTDLVTSVAGKIGAVTLVTGDIIGVATARLLGRDTAGSGPAEELTAADVRTLINVEDGAAAPPYVEADFANNAVTNAKLADMATDRIKGRTTAGSGDPEDLTKAQVLALLNVEDGATGDQTAGEIEAIVNHDNLLGFVLAEHVDWAGAGAGTIHVDNYIEGGAGTDVTAIHDDVAGEITAVSEKTDPIGADVILIEDSEASNAKKKVQLSNLASPSTLASGEWRFATDITGTPTGNGRWERNNAAPASTTSLVIDDLTDPGFDASNILALVRAGDSIIIQQKDTSANWERYDVTGTPTDNPSDFTIPVSLESQGTTISSNNTPCVIFILFGSPGAHTHLLADITDSGDLAALDTVDTAEIDDEAVTLAKMQHIAAQRLLGRSTAGSGDVEEMTGATALGVLGDAEKDWGARTHGFTLTSNTISSGSSTIDWKDGNKQELELDENVTTLNFTNPSQPCSLTFRVFQDGTGGRTLVWPSAIKWLAGQEPTVSAGPTDIDIFTFFWDGTTYYGAALQDFS